VVVPEAVLNDRAARIEADALNNDPNRIVLGDPAPDRSALAQKKALL
jgi:hypothetical protein